MIPGARLADAAPFVCTFLSSEDMSLLLPCNRHLRKTLLRIFVPLVLWRSSALHTVDEDVKPLIRGVLWDSPTLFPPCRMPLYPRRRRVRNLFQ